MLPAWRWVSGGEFGLERGDELAPGGQGRVVGAPAADQDNGGGEGVGAHADHAVGKFGAHGPCARNGETRTNHGVKKRLPSSAGSPRFALGLRLLEGIVDRGREVWM